MRSARRRRPRFADQASDERFHFHLCDRLGWGSVALMLDGMSAREMLWWRVLCETEAAEREEAEEKRKGR
jgi:hypothetical protein